MFLRLICHIFLAKVLEIYEAKLPAGLLYDVTCLSMRGIWPLWPILWYFLPFLRILLWHTPTMGQPAQTWDWQRPPPRDNSLIILMSDIFSLADKKSADNRSRFPLMFTFITHVFHQRREKAEMDWLVDSMKIQLKALYLLSEELSLSCQKRRLLPGQNWVGDWELFLKIDNFGQDWQFWPG